MAVNPACFVTAAICCGVISMKGHYMNVFVVLCFVDSALTPVRAGKKGKGEL